MKIKQGALKFVHRRLFWTLESSEAHLALHINLIKCSQLKKSCVCMLAKLTPWTVAHQDLLSMGFPRKEY